MTLIGEQTIKDGQYCLSYNRKREPVGNDPDQAHRLLLKKRDELLTVSNGGSVFQANEEEPKVSGKLQAAFEFGYKISSTAKPTPHAKSAQIPALDKHLHG
jgi:hypothetical protein